jgi:hypothetical protein
MRTFRLAATALLATAAGAGYTESPIQIPPVHATVLTGQTVDLPAALQGKSAVLVLGFSQASREQATDWGKRLAADYRTSGTVLYYEMPVLEAVPRLLRGWVTKKIAESVPERARDHFLIVLDHEKEWRAAVAYNKSDDAYVVVVDSAGTIRARLEGPASDANFAEVKRQLAQLQ